MKLKKLTIKNINSLFGTWEINFEDEAYVNNPIFAITGKNGSGKSTILDAISLALYDQTARLGKSGARNAFASHGTKEAMAALVFELDGREYTSQMTLTAGRDGVFKTTPAQRATWIQWMDEKGLTQTLYGTEDKKKKVQEVLGLDFNQFCQVILLAQGKFNAFLTADSDKRAEILEKITNTAIYTKIGEVVNRRKCDSVNDFKGLKQKLEGIRDTMLPEEDIQAKEARLKAIGDEESSTRKELTALAEILDAVKKFHECEENLKAKGNEDAALKDEEEKFDANDRGRLTSGRKAANVTSAYEAFTKLDAEQKREEKRQSDLTAKEIPAKEQTEQEKSTLLKKAEESLTNKTAEQSARVAILDAADALDKEIVVLQNQFDSAKKSQKRRLEERRLLEDAVAECEKNLTSLDTQKTDGEKYLQEHRQDEQLEAKSIFWQGKYDTLLRAKDDIENDTTTVKKLEKDADSASKKKDAAAETLRQAQAACDKAVSAFSDAESKLAAALNGKTLEMLEVDKNEQQKTVNLLQALEPKTFLENFAEGTPCPVCGATHHPYRALPKAALPNLEIAQKRFQESEEKFIAASKADKACTSADAEMKIAKGHLANAESNLAACTDACNSLLKNLETARDSLKGKQDAYDKDTTVLQGELATFGFPWDGKTTLPSNIQTRRDEYKKHQDELADFETKRQGFLTVKSRKEGELSAKADECTREENALNDLKGRLATQLQERKDKYSDVLDSRAERQTLAKAVRDAQKAKDDAATAHTKAQAELDASKNESDALNTSLAGRMAELHAKHQALDAVLQENGLDLSGYQNSVLEPSILAALVSTETSLKERRIHLTKAVNDLKNEQSAAQAKLPEGFDEDAMREKQTKLKDTWDALQSERGEINSALEKHHDTEKILGEAKKELDALDKETQRWEQLDKWIGGKNFRAHAQHYTFDVLMAKANEQIHGMMNGRYSLCTNAAADDLSVQVIDEFLGNDIRPSANLSGGEQFAVSMALALGLSEMVGQKFHVDSLFLDEGFGTLDKDELENAMNILTGLTTQGKLVGVISHMEHLQDAIGVKIQLAKNGDGHSRLEGPGITKVADPELFGSKTTKKRKS